MERNGDVQIVRIRGHAVGTRHVKLLKAGADMDQRGTGASFLILFVHCRHPPMPEGVAMELMEAIYHRRAIRDYTPASVETATLRMLIEAATQAPSAMNLQPWSFAVVASQDRLLHFSEEAKAYLLKHMPDFPKLSRYRDRFADPGFNIFYNAPVLVVVCAITADTQAAEDCALAAQNLMLAAHGHGLGTCCIGFARPWLNTPAGKAALGIPSAHVPIIPIIIGWPKETVSDHLRRPPDIHWLAP